MSSDCIGTVDYIADMIKDFEFVPLMFVTL